MENYLGRMLVDDEVVHHINENEKKNNSIENLDLCLSHIHAKYHAKHGRTYVTLICDFCGNEFQREIRQTYKGYKKCYCNRTCMGNSMRKTPPVAEWISPKLLISFYAGSSPVRGSTKNEG
jgi:hypothetical protein